MIFTMNSVAQDVFESSRSDWKSLATNHQFQGVQTSFHHSWDHAFSCDQVNMACDIRRQASAFLVPWYCKSSFRYILTHLETISQKLEIEYELDSGSTMMGAVKLGNLETVYKRLIWTRVPVACAKLEVYMSGMTNSYSSYSQGAWQPCSQPGHHACLNNYPIQVYLFNWN